MLARLLPAASKVPAPDHIKNILIIRPGGIGDAVLLIPAIKHIKTRYPESQITVLAEKRNAEVFELTPSVDMIYRYDMPGDFLAALKNSYDIVIDTEQWHRLSAITARLARAGTRIGFNTNERQRMFTIAAEYSHDDYEMISFFNLLTRLKGLSAAPDSTTCFLSVPPYAVEKAVSCLGSVDSKRYVVIFPGASIPERRWGAEKFKLVAESLQSEGYGIVVAGGPAEKNDGSKIAGQTGINLAGMTSLAVTAAVISRSVLLISGDSGVLHLAVGLGIPTVSMFGPGRHLKWAPGGNRDIVINKKLPCSPCTTFGTTPPCTNNTACMNDITTTEVLEAARKLLETDSC